MRVEIPECFMENEAGQADLGNVSKTPGARFSSGKRDWCKIQLEIFPKWNSSIVISIEHYKIIVGVQWNIRIS